MAVKVQLEPAWVLHTRAFRETSLLVDIFTRGHGRIAVVARGARGPRSRQRGLLQGFRPLLVSWVARGELGTLTGCEPAGPPTVPQGKRTLSGFYLNELLQTLLRRDDAHPVLFDRYGEALAGLAGVESQSVVLRLFEKRLLEALGYGLNLTHEADTGVRLDPDASYEYRPEHGAVRVARARPGSLAGRSLLALNAETLDEPAVLADVRGLLKAALDVYLEGRPLKVRQVADALRR